MFGKVSLPIHAKSCVAKREASTSFCEVCDQIVSNDEYSKHVEECRRVNAGMLAKKRAAAPKPAATAKGKGAAAAESAGGPLALTGSAVGAAAAGAGAGAAAGAAAAARAAAATAATRSKIPDHVLRQMMELSEPPEIRIMRKLGQPCDACGSVAADTACLGCHAVYCAACSAGIHEVNKALSGHTPVFDPVRVRVAGV